MLLVNTDYISGKELEMLGLVKGSTIQSKNIGRDITQSFKTLVGGELKAYTEMMNEARALATKPAILLADEPTGNLDSKTSQDVLSLMKVTGQKFAQTMVMITHNEEIAQMADRIVRIEDGRLITR